MKKIKIKNSRTIVQILIFASLVGIVAIYNLYIEGRIDFKILSIGDMNPYGGWSVLHSFATDSSYVFDGISRSVALTIAIIAMAIIGGRFFCGWLCPVGALQDFTSWIGNKLRINSNKDIKISKLSLTSLKYPLLLLIILSAIFGYGSVVAGLSPWRALLSLNNMGSVWKEMKIGLMVLFGIIVVSVFVSRIFCRYLCPLGAVQSLFSSISILNIKHSNVCSSCNKCLDSCPVGLQFSSESTAVSPECIRCLKCVENCKVSKDIRTNINFSKAKLKKIVYTTLMIVVFFSIWFGAPKILGMQASAEDILLKPLRDGIYEGEARGFAGKIITEVSITDGKIIGIKIIDHSESRGWYDEAFMILPREIINRQRLNVDAISGATKTSKGLIESIENAIRNAYDK